MNQHATYEYRQTLDRLQQEQHTRWGENSYRLPAGVEFHEVVGQANSWGAYNQLTDTGGWKESCSTENPSNRWKTRRTHGGQQIVFAPHEPAVVSAPTLDFTGAERHTADQLAADLPEGLV